MKCIAHVGLIVVFSLAAATAHADEIKILSGHLDVTWGQPPSAGSLALTGGRGFSFPASDSNVVFAGTDCRADLEFGVPCTPGTPVAFIVALAPFGSATLDGVTYPDVGGNDAFLMIQLNSSAMLPPLAPTGTAAGVFRVDDDFNAFQYVDAGGQTHTERFSGGGTATFTFSPNPSSPGRWVVGAVSFDFQPIPEPSTLMLAGTALTLLWRGSRAAKRA